MEIQTVLLLLISVFLGAFALTYYTRFKKQEKAWKEHDTAVRDQMYEVVHELRAPLTAVKDAASLVNASPNNLTPDEQSKMLGLIKSECVKLLDHVSAFLDASKVMNNKLTVQPTPGHLKDLLEEKILMFTPQAKTANLTLVGDVDPQLPTVMYDQKLLSQVMNNLLSNSLKYTPAGGTITLSAKANDHEVMVSVFDNGLGVPDEKQKELFTKFATLPKANQNVMSSGLGLYVVKGIIEAHKGTVTVETHESRGYKVTFTLPLSTMPASISENLPQAVAANAAS